MSRANPMASADPKPRCGATTKQGQPCLRSPGYGTGHLGQGRCKFHGGASPQAEVAGAVALAKDEARIMGTPIDLEPHEALLQCIRIAAGELQYATVQVGELKKPMVSTMFGPKLHTWIEVRQAAMDRLVSYSKIALAAGIAERHVRIAEGQGELIAGAIRNVLAALGVADHPEAPSVVRRELTLIAGGQAA